MNYEEIILEIKLTKRRLLNTATPCEQVRLVVALIALYESALVALKRRAEEDNQNALNANSERKVA